MLQSFASDNRTEILWHDEGYFMTKEHVTQSRMLLTKCLATMMYSISNHRRQRGTCQIVLLLVAHPTLSLAWTDQWVSTLAEVFLHP